MPANSGQEDILVLTPLGRDAELTAAALTEAGFAPQVCRTLGDLISRLETPAGAVLIAEEALDPASTPQLMALLEAQESWSDLPIIMLTSGGKSTLSSQQALELFSPRANVTLLERPVRVVTLRHTVQVALRARRRQYQTRHLLQQREQVLASIRDAFVTLDRDWRYTYVNQVAADLAGRPAESFLGQNIWELFPELVGTAFDVQVREAMKDRQPRHFEWGHEAARRWFSLRVYPSEDGVALLTTEITQRKYMESILQKSQRRLHLALETSELGLWYWDLPDGKLTWDLNCRRHFGFPPDEEITIEIYYSLIHPDDREMVREAIQRALGERRQYDIEHRVLHPDGSQHWLQAIGRTFVHDDGRPSRFDGITIDISERKATECELERAQLEAIEANRAKDHFLAALSHELRTPLTPVLMTVAALQHEPGLPAHVLSDLEIIQRNVELEARLIDDLLDLTRVTRGKLILLAEIVDVHELLERALENCRNGEASGKQQQIEVRREAREHFTFGDPARLQQILWNLFNNAAKFTPSGERIEITTSNPRPGRIAIVIRDSGIGIDPSVLPRLFDAFQQGHPSITRRFGGLGLGLAISKSLADLHGGQLTAASAGRGRGATFTLELNSAVAPSRPARVPSSSKRTGPPLSLRVLLVEDHAATRLAITRLLTRAGHRVKSAGTVANALELVSEGRFDLLLSDLGLPDASGLELMHELRNRDYHLPGIALSGYGMEEDVRASAEAGFQAHVTKPVDWRRLEETLLKVVAQNIPTP